MPHSISLSHYDFPHQTIHQNSHLNNDIHLQPPNQPYQKKMTQETPLPSFSSQPPSFGWLVVRTSLHLESQIQAFDSDEYLGDFRTLDAHGRIEFNRFGFLLGSREIMFEMDLLMSCVVRKNICVNLHLVLLAPGTPQAYWSCMLGPARLLENGSSRLIMKAHHKFQIVAKVTSERNNVFCKGKGGYWKKKLKGKVRSFWEGNAAYFSMELVQTHWRSKQSNMGYDVRTTKNIHLHPSLLGHLVSGEAKSNHHNLKDKLTLPLWSILLWQWLGF